MFDEERKLEAQVAEFNRQIFAFEDLRVNDMKDAANLLDYLQENLKLPKTSTILNASLDAMMQARSQDEMDVYLQSYLAALDAITIPEVIDIDGCVNSLREAAVDVISFTNFFLAKEFRKYDSDNFLSDDMREEAAKKFKAEVEKVLEDTIIEAEAATAKFKDKATKMQNEFSEQIKQNNARLQELERIGQTVIDDYVSVQAEVARLEEFNIKYAAGIKRLQSQMNQADHVLEAIKKIQDAKDEADLKNLRADYAESLQQLNYMDRMTGYNHFVYKCKVDAQALFAARSSYLPKNIEGVGNQVVAAVQLVGFKLSPGIKLESMPDDFPTFAKNASAMSSGFAARKHPAGKDIAIGVRPGQGKSTKEKLGIISYLKKSATFVLGVSGLIIGALMCATIAFAPKGLIVAGTSIKILRTLLDGSDYITEQAKSIKQNNAIIRKVEKLEQQHAELINSLQAQPQPSRKAAYLPSAQAQPKSKSQESEAKIERLLMGYKADDILSREAIAEIRRRHQQLAPHMVVRMNVENAASPVINHDEDEPPPSDSEKPAPRSH